MDTDRHPGKPGAQVSQLRVTKKLSTRSRGALKLARQFGDALVCVRHRVDAATNLRYTTVELLVEQCEMRPHAARMVQIRVFSHEYAARAMVRAAGGICDSKTGLWTLPRRVVTVLRMTERIVPQK